MLNHYPAIVMTGAAIIYTVGTWRGSERALRSAMYLMVTAAIIALPAFVTGEISGGIAATTHKGPHAEALSVHKNTARLAFLLVGAAGLAAAVGILIFRNGRNVGWLKTLLLILAISASGFIGYTTYLGRQVKWAGADVRTRVQQREPIEELQISLKMTNMQEANIWHA
ncbi:MAG TPA: hypothetical protein PKD26_12635 [Pyrinomonadaceae bacterium]|nr:hypothetical protein [Pyrinomonadaceae bacterium]